MKKIRITQGHTDKALTALTNMATIVKRDRLVKGSYFDLFRRNKPDDAALCKGGKACAIGSLFLGAGVKLEHQGGRWQLPGVNHPTDYACANQWSDNGRPNYGLALALSALNAVAMDTMEKDPKIKRRIRTKGQGFDEPIEMLFEGAFGARFFGKAEMLAVISKAKRRVRAGTVQIVSDPYHYSFRLNAIQRD